MKKVIKSMLILILLVLIIPRIYADEKDGIEKTTYTNYYFFLEPYKENEIDYVIKNGGTTNHTAFPPLMVGTKAMDGATQITLKRDCSGENNCWTYSDFYKKYMDIEKNGMITTYKIGNDDGHTSKFITDKNKSYYSHGSYYSNYSNQWEKYNGESEISDYKNELYLACASISTVDTNICREKQNSDKTFSCLDNNDINNQKDFYVGIKRGLNNNSFNNIKWDHDYDYNKSISKCPYDDKVTPVKSGNSKVVYSPVLYKYEYTVTENKCPVDESKNNDLKCNSSSKMLASNCEMLTIKANEETVVNVKINQKGIVSNILTPTTLYAGGGFKFGILYTNTISWDYVNGTPGGSIGDQVTEQMKNRIKSINDIENSLNLNSIKFGSTSIDSSFFIKECKQEGEFTAGNTLTTTCTVYLPASEFENYTGKITYKIGNVGYGINNKYYTDMVDNGEYSISGDLSGLSVLTDDSASKDGYKNNSWIGDWSVELTDCNINLYTIPVTPTITTNTNNKGYKFLYRPIDINNPFPNRNAGINWFDWYSNIVNKKRLEETYKNLNYVVELDNVMLSTVKKYNNGTNYFDFDTMDNDESTFLKKYFPNAKVGGS